MSAPLSTMAPISVASESVWGKWGRWCRWTTTLAPDASSSVALVEQMSRHLLHHSMLILMELILLMDQCLEVLAHLLG